MQGYHKYDEDTSAQVTNKKIVCEDLSFSVEA